MSFPEEFDFSEYRNNYECLKHLTDEQLSNHYSLYGLFEGHICSKIKDRNIFFNLVDSSKKILEIGPLHAPLFKRPLHNVKYIDFFSREELKVNYKNDINLDVNNIPFIDYVIKNNKYNEVINETFDYCVSSHNIEHVPCVVTFLNNISSVLNSGGFLFLAIPDFRYCFDAYRTETHLFDILKAFYGKNDKPTAINICESKYLTTHNYSNLHWNDSNDKFGYLKKKYDFYNTKNWELLNEFDNIVKIINNNEEYIDSHCWKFTPQSFKNILIILSSKNLIDLHIEKVYNTNFGSNEFYVILRKN